ncbi:MAG TPA: AAA family ATPase, partial [Ktedonobacteraceae bacterium]|nr:AAA family ATPase [Ktedonobacteraceae bacterium]
MEGEPTRSLVFLPKPLTSLLGREEICHKLCTQLSDPTMRLLTLTGTGGVGKTRLALEVVHRLGEHFTDGVYFVSLAATRTPEQVIPAIAQALQCGTGSGSVFEIVQAYLHERHLLLVLDNFEQVRAAAPQISLLATNCPRLTLLITSREILRTPEERVFVVEPLPLPEFTTQRDITALKSNPALALFIERAQALQPELELTEASIRIIAQICVHLDGLPLAIELAAVRIKLLSPAALLIRLARRLQVLTIGTRDAPERQQTLRAT